MTIFEGILVVNLFITLYLSYVVYRLRHIMEEMDDEAEMNKEIMARFIVKIAKEKIDKGEWTENETL